MPITPLHFGPSSLVSLSASKYIDVPAFLLANVVLDIEPVLVMTLSLSYPLHGYAHTYIGSVIPDTILGLLLYRYRDRIQSFTTRWRISTGKPSPAMLIISAVLGGWMHVAIDSIIYHDMWPLYPLTINPLQGMTDQDSMYVICAVLFIPAIIIWTWTYYRGES